MDILVSGGTGYIGSLTCVQLIAAGQRITIGLPATNLHVFDAQGHALERRMPEADLQLPCAA
jgi:UDP-glucose 4-epimerase